MDLRRLKHIKTGLNGLSERRPRRRRRPRPMLAGGQNATAEERVTWLLEQLVEPRDMLVARGIRCLVVGLGGGLVLGGGLCLWAGIFLQNAQLTLASIPFGLIGAIFLRFLPGAVTRHKIALQQLTGYDDIRAIAPLTEALSHPDRKLRHAARIALTRLLPLLTNSTRDLDTTNQSDDQKNTRAGHQTGSPNETPTPECWMRLAHYATSREASPEFVCALLPALVKSGEPRAVATVREFAARTPQDMPQQRVHATALACLKPSTRGTESQPLFIRQKQEGE